MYMYPRPGVGRPRPFFLDRDDMTRGRGTRTKRRSRAADRVVRRHPRIQGTYVSVDSTQGTALSAIMHHGHQLSMASCVVDTVTVTLGVHGARKKRAVQLRVSNVVRTGVSTLPWFPAHDLDGQGPTGEVRCANGLRLFTLRDVRSAGGFRPGPWFRGSRSDALDGLVRLMSTYYTLHCAVERRRWI